MPTAVGNEGNGPLPRTRNTNTMSWMHKAGSALGGLFGTVTTTADAVTQTVNVASSSLDMLSNWVEKAKTEQVVDYELQMEDYIEKAIERHSEDSAQEKDARQKRLASNPSLKAQYEQELARNRGVEARIREKLSRPAPEAVSPKKEKASSSAAAGSPVPVLKPSLNGAGARQ